MSAGGYFKSFDDALKLHAQLSKAGELLKTAGGQASIAAAADNATLLVPGKPVHHIYLFCCILQQ